MRTSISSSEKFCDAITARKLSPVIVFDDDSHLTEPTNAQLAEKLGLPK